MEKGKDTLSQGLALKEILFVVLKRLFHELYSRDNHFCSLNLSVNGRIGLAKGLVENLCFDVEYCGEILNGNRSQYLRRLPPMHRC